MTWPWTEFLLSLNDDECVFKASEIPFQGMLISRDGVCLDPSKVEALKDAFPPTNKLEVMSFLCILQANAEFVPNLSWETVHLRALTQKHKGFKCLKTLFHEDAFLCNFNPTSLHTSLWMHTNLDFLPFFHRVHLQTKLVLLPVPAEPPSQLNGSTHN